MKTYIKTLIVACFALAAFSPVGAEVFTKTYTTVESQNFKLITDTMLGPGFAANPSGKIVGGNATCQIGVFSNLVAKCIPTFTNGVVLSTGDIAHGASLTNRVANDDGEDLYETGYGLDHDADLEGYFNEDEDGFRDCIGLILYLKPKNATINIPFVMASEEFFYQKGGTPVSSKPDQNSYESGRDKFAFLLAEVPTNEKGDVVDGESLMEPYWNLAKFRDVGDVGISTVNQHTNTEYFISNVVSNENGQLLFPTNDLALPMEYNGAINGTRDGLVAVATNLDTRKTYKLKIVIGDGGSRNTKNSVLFLRTQGITSGNDLSIKVTGPEPLSEPGPVTFTNIVSNIGEISAEGVVVTNYLPLGISTADVEIQTDNVGVIGGWQQAGETNFCVWTIGDHFAAGSNAMMRIVCTQALPIGSYTNIATVASSYGDYDETNNTAEFEAKVGGDVPELPTLTVTAISTNWTYGAMPQDLTSLKFIKSIDTNETHNVTVTGITVEFTNAVGDVVNPIAAADAGTYGIRLKDIDGTGITGVFKDEIVYNPGVLRIDRAPLTITAGNTNKVYGTTLVLGNTNFKCTGLKNGDTIETVELTSAGTDPTAGVTVEGGEYPIVPGDVLTGDFDPNNYEITPENGKLEVKPLDLYIVVRDFPDKEYGRECPLFGDECSVTDKDGNEYTFSEDPDAPLSRFCLIGEDYVDVHLTCDACGNSGKKVISDDYVVSVDASVGNGLGNYIIHTTPGKITVTKLAITITALDTNKVYGTELELDGTAFKITQGNLAEGDEISSVNLTSDGTNKVVAVNEVDGYPITPVSVKESNITELEKKYDVSYADGKLRVKKRDLTLKLNNVTKEYRDDLTIEGTNFTVSADTPLPDFEIPTNVASIVCTADTSEVGDFPGTVVSSPDPVVSGSHTMEPVYNFDANNYKITFENGDLKVTPAELTINVNDNTWRVGKSEPDNANSYVPFKDRLKGEDTEKDVIGGKANYTNRTLTAKYVPTADEAKAGKVYEDEIWIKLDGGKAKNYTITVKPGDMAIKLAAVKLSVELKGSINWWTGCEDMEFTVKNEGDTIPADYDYWVEFKPTTNSLGQIESCILKGMTFNPATKKFEMISADPMKNGYEYIDLTDTVTNELVATGNRDTVFNNGEQITITGFSFYYSTPTGARHLMKDVIGKANPTNFFVAGRLFNPADTDKDFVVSPGEKAEAKGLLGESISDYLEMTRLNLLPYYHWSTADQTWK